MAAPVLRGLRRPSRRRARGGPSPLALLSDRYGARGFPILTIVYRVTPEPAPIRAADDVAEASWFERTKMPYRSIRFESIRRALRRWL